MNRTLLAFVLVATSLAACQAAPPAQAPRTQRTAGASQTDQQATDSVTASERSKQLCVDLDSPDLGVRTEATRILQDEFLASLVAGGTEQQMEACADWCAINHGQPLPSWYSARSELTRTECEQMVKHAQRVSVEAIDEPGWLEGCLTSGTRAKYDCIMAAADGGSFYRCIGE